MKKWSRLLVLLLVICPVFALAQDGTLDLSFDGNGIVRTDFLERMILLKALTNKAMEKLSL